MRIKGAELSNKFRPVVPDDSGILRERYAEILKKSELNRAAFNRKMVEAGLAVLGNKYAKREA